MGLTAPSRNNWIRSRNPRVRPRSAWPQPKESKFTLTLVSSETSSWPVGEAEPDHAHCGGGGGLSESYREAIAMLRSLREVGEEEARKQRETWQMLEESLNEDRYH